MVPDATDTKSNTQGTLNATGPLGQWPCLWRCRGSSGSRGMEGAEEASIQQWFCADHPAADFTRTATALRAVFNRTFQPFSKFKFLFPLIKLLFDQLFLNQRLYEMLGKDESDAWVCLSHQPAPSHHNKQEETVEQSARLLLCLCWFQNLGSGKSLHASRLPNTLLGHSERSVANQGPSEGDVEGKDRGMAFWLLSLVLIKDI